MAQPRAGYLPPMPHALLARRLQHHVGPKPAAALFTMSTVIWPMTVLPYCCLKLLILVCSLGIMLARTSFRFWRGGEQELLWGGCHTPTSTEAPLPLEWLWRKEQPLARQPAPPSSSIWTPPDQGTVRRPLPHPLTSLRGKKGLILTVAELACRAAKRIHGAFCRERHREIPQASAHQGEAM